MRRRTLGGSGTGGLRTTSGRSRGRSEPRRLSDHGVPPPSTVPAPQEQSPRIRRAASRARGEPSTLRAGLDPPIGSKALVEIRRLLPPASRAAHAPLSAARFLVGRNRQTDGIVG